MAGDHECYKRPDNARPAKASALSRFLDSEAFLIVVLVTLGVVNYGWVIYPALGTAFGILNGAIVAGILIAGMAVRWYRRRERP